MRAIDVSGYRYCDIVLYLAGLLNAMGEKVFVRDLSEDTTLYKYLPRVERLGNDDIMELKGVLFAQGYKVIPEECTYCFDLQEPSSDTVFVKERRDRSRNRDLHDTVYVNIHDTVFVPKYVPKFLEIPRELTREEQTKITIGEWTINIAVALAVALLVFLTIKILKR